MIKKHIPNTLTCANLVCGCTATHFAFLGRYEVALLCIIAGAVFDFFDGFAARLLHVSSPIGKELDSLADCVTFGFAPSAMLYHLLQQLHPEGMSLTIATALPYVAFVMAAFSALRLAKFNLDERQTTGFIGLPTPANALFWGALIVSTHTFWKQQDWSLAALIVLCLFSCWILVSEVPMFALKFKHFGLRGNELRYGFILLSAILLACFGIVGFSAIIVCYILLSLVVYKRS